MNNIPYLLCSCSSVLIKSCDDGIKIRSKIILIKSDASYIICKDCGQEVKVPLSVNLSELSPPLLIRK